MDQLVNFGAESEKITNLEKKIAIIMKQYDEVLESKTKNNMNKEIKCNICETTQTKPFK